MSDDEGEPAAGRDEMPTGRVSALSFTESDFEHDDDEDDDDGGVSDSDDTKKDSARLHTDQQSGDEERAKDTEERKSQIPEEDAHPVDEAKSSRRSSDQDTDPQHQRTEAVLLSRGPSLQFTDLPPALLVAAEEERLRKVQQEQELELEMMQILIQVTIMYALSSHLVHSIYHVVHGSALPYFTVLQITSHFLYSFIHSHRKAS